MIRIILISSVMPSPTSAGQVLLFRHLVDDPNIDLKILDLQARKKGFRSLFRKILCSLSNSKCRRYASDITALWKGRWLDSELPEPVNTKNTTVVMTVAHGDVCYAAMRYAKKYKLPLVTIFHDWWPDMAGAHKLIRGKLDRDFRVLYQSSDLALCVCAGMIEQLGAHPNCSVLYPIPSAHLAAVRSVDHDQLFDSKFRILYAGNFGQYSSMLMEALKIFMNDPRVRLEVRGPEPDWPETFKNDLKSRGLLLPFVQGDEFEKWLSSADAYLIPMSFEPHDRRRMETSFLSKITEYSRLGRPLVVWSPSYGSAYRWADRLKSNIVVNEPSPESLQRVIHDNIDDFDKVEALKQAAAHDLRGEFEPSEIQAQFLGSLKHLVGLDS